MKIKHIAAIVITALAIYIIATTDFNEEDPDTLNFTLAILSIIWFVLGFSIGGAYLTVYYQDKITEFLNKRLW